MKKILSLIACGLFVGTVACGSSQKPEPAKPGDQPTTASPSDPSQPAPPPANPCQPKK